jgi:hypothetical protein
MKFKRMSEVDLRGKRVFIRADLNVPIEQGRISDGTSAARRKAASSPRTRSRPSRSGFPSFSKQKWVWSRTGSTA